MTDRSFQGRVALITGASRGLGRGLALELARQGADVLALARTVGGLEELDEEIRAAGGQATLVPLDLAKAEDADLERLAEAILGRWGKLDIWAHTAVTAPPLAPVEHVGATDLDVAFSLNVRALQRVIRVLDPVLRKSDAARVLHFPDRQDGPRPNHSAYLASKVAAETILGSWQQTVERSSAIRVVEAVLPPMATTLRRKFHPGEDRTRLAEPSVLAERLVAQLVQDLPGPIDLRD
ncbi:MAG: SDR family NAD(P)-dependent oxidoreductase [Pseudomonadota bacterium]